MLKSKKILKIVAILTLSLSLGVIGYLVLLGSVWSQFDYQVMDYFYRQAVAAGDGVKKSGQVTYLKITDETYRYFGKNTLDRAGLACVNDALDDLGVEAVAYDLIFSRPADAVSDQIFAESIDNLASVYLPIGFGISQEKVDFKWQDNLAYERLQHEYLSSPVEINRGLPYSAKRASMQLDIFSQQAAGAGHISASSDEDGVYRHICMLIKVDSLYFPTLTLSMFLDYVEVPFDSVIVEWGKHIRIPALRDSFIDRDVVIPINERGMAFIPFAHTWGDDFQQMTVQTLLERLENTELQGELERFFEGNFVFIGEASIGIADLGQTPLENDVPLVAIHASMMNALLQNQFYREWQLYPTIGFIAGIAIIFGIAAGFKRNSILYSVGVAFFASILFLSWYEMAHFSLFPLMTVGRSCAVIFVGLVIGLQVAISRDQLFIRNAFSKYVPERIVNELLAHPEQLQLGGEERELTVLFSDLVGFTTISEKIPPRRLVRLLNDYFSEMTKIILDEGGIIDKYLGDAIMAEFGAPLKLLDHPVRAVHAALRMQTCLAELKNDWAKIRLPALQCRVGINTGMMVVGNMGSHQTFDYTVVGDAVNLASRLESANKFYGTSLMISEVTCKQLPPGIFRTRLLDVIKVKGKSRTIQVYEVYGWQNKPVQRKENKYYQAYASAFEAYFEQDFEFARQLFSEALRYRPHDLAAHTLIRRIAAITPEMLENGWDGSVALLEK
ncbi:MAG: CHASE2 domain-containing protein [bacterium]